MPLAVEQFDLSSYELVISSSYAVAKGVLTGPHQLHLCMCYSPIRYAWDLQHQYLRESGLTSGLRGWAAKWLLHRMRLWDLRTSNGVDQFIAISHFIRQRIWKVYRRESTVIYPPVDINAFSLETIKGEYYLTASRMVPYKRIGLIVRAFSQLPDRQLIVIGEGPDFEKIKRHAPPNVKMLGYQPFSVLKHHMQHARAFIFAAEEDFGIVPIEAQSCGTPVIAYGRGGSRETVEEDKTGVFFNTQTPEAIVEALNRFETCLEKFDPLYIRKHTENFSASRFRNEFCAFVERAWENALI
jgi:glycosyltransferase involved in cell wall biosynthesis